MACDDYVFPDDDYLNGLGTFWNTEQQNSLAAFGVTLTMIRAASETLRSLPAVQLHRLASTQAQLDAVADIVGKRRLWLQAPDLRRPGGED